MLMAAGESIHCHYLCHSTSVGKAIENEIKSIQELMNG